MKRTRFSWRVAAVVGVLALVAATAVAASAWARGGHAQATTLVDGTTDSVTNIDPANEYDYGSFTLDLLIFQGLYGFPNGAKLEPVLATGCAPRATMKTWSCTLRKNVKFADGTAFDLGRREVVVRPRAQDQGRPGHLRAALEPEEHDDERPVRGRRST